LPRDRPRPGDDRAGRPRRPPGLGNLPSTPEGFDALREAGAQQIIMRLGYPWDFAAVERLVAWRENTGA